MAGPVNATTDRAARAAVIPEALADVALIDGKGAAAAACMSVSMWQQLVQEGRAPRPVIRRNRFSRWRLADVRAWLAEYPQQAGA